MVGKSVPSNDGAEMPPIPFGPSVYLLEFRIVIGTISPNPRVTMAR